MWVVATTQQGGSEIDELDGPYLTFLDADFEAALKRRDALPRRDLIEVLLLTRDFSS
jgi:hypothetical protein